MRASDAVIGVVLILFALAEMMYTRTFPTLHGQAYGPNLFPLLIGLGLCICGAILLVRGVQKRRVAAQTQPQSWFEFDESWQQPAVRFNLVLLLLSLLLYILLSDWIGFMPMSLVILTVLLVRLGSTFMLALTLAGATTLILYLLFAKVLLVPLPSGMLQGLIA